MPKKSSTSIISQLLFFTRKWSAIKRISVGFAIILMLMIGINVNATFDVTSINHQMSVINDNHAVKMRNAINWRGSVHDQAISARDLVLAPDQARRDKALKEIADLRRDYHAASQAMEELLALPEVDLNENEASALKSVKDQANIGYPALDQFLTYFHEGELLKAEDVLVNQIGPIYSEWLTLINVFIDKQEALQAEATNNVLSIADRFLSEMMIMSLIAMAVGIAIALLIPRYLQSILGADPDEIQSFARRIGRGDLNISTITSSPKNSESIMALLIEVCQNLSHTITQVRDTAALVSQNSQEIASGNSELTSKTDQQAAGITQTASAMEELSSTVKQNTDNARYAEEEANRARVTAGEGNEAVQGAIQVIKEFSQSSEDIASIISTIDGIAFQTNILALNASVEAARAGEHGRGFAVVAQEVRNLAQRSKEAASEISQLISRNNQNVQHGNQRAESASKAMRDIVEAIGKVTTLMQEISQASDEQRQGVHEVGDSINHIDQATQQNLALVEHSNKVASELNEQAIHLVSIMNDFKTIQ